MNRNTKIREDQIKEKTLGKLRLIQKKVFEKFEEAISKLQNPTFNDIRKIITDKSLPKSKRIAKEELQVALLYLKDQRTPDPIYEWDSNFPLEKIGILSDSKTINEIEKNLAGDEVLDISRFLKPDPNPVPKPGSSLIPIKGISKTMQAKLRRLYIYDIPTLLTKGRKYGKRKLIAKKLDVDVKLVNSWVKQADLWRVEGMTTDMAYLLVQVGVRCIEDLAKVDVEKAYPILQNINASQIDFSLLGKESLKIIIKNAELLLKFSVNPLRHDVIKEQIIEVFNLYRKCCDNREITATGNSLPEVSKKYVKDKLFKQFDNYFTHIETIEKPPFYLFKADLITEEVKVESIDKILNESLGFLDDLDYTLPLPKSIRGKVYIKKMNELDKDKKPLAGVLVEISGIVYPTDDKTELDKKPRCYTDGVGRFIISMPERYSVKEALTISISQGSKKQKFLITAEDFIDSVPEQKILNKFLLLNSLVNRADELKERIEKLKKYQNYLEGKAPNSLTYKEKEKFEEIKIALRGRRDRELSLNKQLEEIENQYQEKELELEEKYATSNIRSAFERFIPLSSNLTAEIKPKKFEEDKEEENKKNDGFIIIQEIFEGFRTDMPKAMPSVKLMGEGKNIVKLPTDTAPSSIFTYQMLQRLKEPSISTSQGARDNSRKTLNQPLDVEDFKQKMYSLPDSYPKMSSLGIGYTLNMHQAWVPDGFALGSLLYSTVLAPGEEERIVVRENKQNYTLSDRARGMDTVSEDYALFQEDDTAAAFNYAVNQFSQANSNYSYSAKTSSFGGSFGIGGFVSGVAAMFGLSGGYSKARGRASASARQSNAHNEVSNTAQNFQHSIKSASDKISQSKRISMQTATSEVSNSVATKILANHNHSHTMTIQYWEIMRRYRMETCIDSIDLVLFVPLKVISFLPKGEKFSKSLSDIKVSDFYNRYDKLIKHANVLQRALPYNYRKGLSILRKYASYPKWRIEDRDSNGLGTQLVFEITGTFLSIDDISADLVLKNGRRSGANVEVMEGFSDRLKNSSFSWRKELIDAIKAERKKKGNVKIKLRFDISRETIVEDLNYIEIKHNCEDYEYVLDLPLYSDGMHKDEFYDDAKNKGYKDYQIEAIWMYESKQVDLYQDIKKSGYDKKKMAHAYSGIPYDYLNPNVRLSSYEIKSLGAPKISSYMLVDMNIEIIPSGITLYSALRYSFVDNTPILLLSELQKIEDTLRHVAESTIFYSQIVWASLTPDERAMLLEPYTIDMDFDEIVEIKSEEKEQKSQIDNRSKKSIKIPLLNCVNIKKSLGFYGNCMLLPFTYPESLAKKLGKTAADVQNALYIYHNNNFRASTTTISLPTDGMIGEAVLGETNVSEKIDLTRFWNWKDSPIDKMDIDSSFLNSNDYLAGKSTKDISGLNLQGATVATPVTVPDLVSTLVNKQAPKFDNITGLDQLKEVLNAGTKSAAEGRDTAVKTSADVAKATLDFLKPALEAEKHDNSNKEQSNNNTTSTPSTLGSDSSRASNTDSQDASKDSSSNDSNNEENASSPSKKLGDDRGNDDNGKDLVLMQRIENILEDAHKMTPAELYKKYTGKEYDEETVKNEAKKASGNDYDVAKALISLMLN